MMTRKAYRQIAEAISLTYPGEPDDAPDMVLNQWFGMVNKLCRMFKDDNARFDTVRFVQACKQKPKGIA
jgi:hypothetical protein